jgi:hypothetical protein
MRRNLCSFAAAVLFALLGSQAIWAQKPLGILRMPYLDIPHRVNLHNFAYREFVTLSAPKGPRAEREIFERARVGGWWVRLARTRQVRS